MGGMITTLENRSARLFTLLGLLLCAAVFFCSAAVSSFQNRAAAKAEVEFRISLAGRLIRAGFSEEEAASLAASSPDEESLAAGKSVMSGYGFKEGSALGGEYMYSAHLASDLTAALGVLLCVMLGTALNCRLFGKLRLITQSIEHEKALPVCDDRDVDMLCEAVKALRKNTSHLLDTISAEKQYLYDYLNDFSHQIKTPCTGLILNNDILSGAEMPFEEQQEYFFRDRNCLERISRLVSESLKLARLEAGVVEYCKTSTDISEPVAEAVEQLSAIAEENDVKIINDVQSGITLVCDRLWLCEAVSNFVKNAAEHSHGGQVRISAGCDPVTVRMIIEDNGCGITEEELPKVFRRFYSRSNAVTSNSVGIGMSIAKRITEDMGGKVFIDSEVGKGTKITLEFLRTVT